ncbi:MAG TPA: DUF4350 domain-containing protein [Actinomycetes bacterium]|nr:DUF4350 domain-containing protein [Actinomycetes bacterium]
MSGGIGSRSWVGPASGAVDGGAGARSPVRRALPWVAVVLGVALVVAVAGRGAEEGNPLDPASPGPLGTKGLVEVLRGLGGRVTVSAGQPGTGTDTALLLSDDLTPQRRQGLLDWVRRGGTLVVADPSSGVTRVEQVGSTRFGLLDAEIERRCAVPALRDAERVAAPGGVVFEIPEGQGAPGNRPGATQACFPRNDGAWLLVQPLGGGTVVRLGGASALVNQELGEADNAILLASLLVPVAGTAVQVLQPPLPGGGTAGLGDLIAPRVRLALWQLVLAFVLLALWRARRLGRPVAEPQPVQLPGAELVVAVGNLLQRAKGRGQAAGLLTDDLRRSLAERLGLPPSTPADQVADTVAERTGIPRERVLRTLTRTTPRDEAELVALSQAADSIRREVTRVR